MPMPARCQRHGTLGGGRRGRARPQWQSDAATTTILLLYATDVSTLRKTDNHLPTLIDYYGAVGRAAF